MFTSLTPVRGNVPCCVRSCGKTISGFASFVLGNFLQVTTSSHFLCVDIYIYICVYVSFVPFLGKTRHLWFVYVTCLKLLHSSQLFEPSLRGTARKRVSQAQALAAVSATVFALTDLLHGSHWLPLRGPACVQSGHFIDPGRGR